MKGLSGAAPGADPVSSNMGCTVFLPAVAVFNTMCGLQGLDSEESSGTSSHVEALQASVSSVLGMKEGHM